jgi:hypothetical protein
MFGPHVQHPTKQLLCGTVGRLHTVCKDYVARLVTRFTDHRM